MSATLKWTCLLSALASTGCLGGRSLRTVQQSGDHNVTLVRTHDHYTYLPYYWGKDVDQFWTCAEANKTITCHKACDGTTDLACPAFGAGDSGGGNAVK